MSAQRWCEHNTEHGSRRVAFKWEWCLLTIYGARSWCTLAQVRWDGLRAPRQPIHLPKRTSGSSPPHPPPMSDHLIFDLVCPRRPRRFGCVAFAVTPSVGISGSSAILPKGKCVDLLASLSLWPLCLFASLVHIKLSLVGAAHLVPAHCDAISGIPYRPPIALL